MSSLLDKTVAPWYICRGSDWFERLRKGDKHMGKLRIFSSIALSVLTASAFALTWEFGGILGGGFDFGAPSGTYFEDKEARLAELGSSAPGSLGSSLPDIFPALSIGGYAELDFFDWLGARIEPRVSMLGSAFMAYTDAGAAFDRYGAYFFGLLLPLYVRGSYPLGPGFITGCAGGFYGVVLSGVALADRYVSSSTTTWISLSMRQIEFYGISGGLGYSMQLGPGIARAEARADWALTPVRFTAGSLEGELHPVGVTLAIGYGVRIGGWE